MKMIEFLTLSDSDKTEEMDKQKDSKKTTSDKGCKVQSCLRVPKVVNCLVTALAGVYKCFDDLYHHRNFWAGLASLPLSLSFSSVKGVL